MTIKFSNYDLQDLLSLPFQQENGTKRLAALFGLILVGFIIPLVPLFFAAGYSGKIIYRIVKEDGEFHLPSWDDIGGIFLLGLKTNGAAALYMLPSTIFVIGGYIFMMFPVFSDIFSPSYGYMSDAEAMAQMGAMFGGMAIIGIGLLLSFPISFILPVSLIHLIAEDRFAAAFELKKWWAILKSNLSGFFVAVVLTFGLYFVAIFAAQLFYMTLVLCILVPVILSAAIAYMSVIASAVFGIAYKDGVQKSELEMTEVEA